MRSSRRIVRIAIGLACALAAAATTYAAGFKTNYHYDAAGNLLIACSPGTDDCDGNTVNGCETNLTTDANHCSSCTHLCSQAHASESCVNGGCVLNSCSSGYANCDANVENGCENPLSSLADCGGCGVKCGPLANATASCGTRTCQLQSCNAGYANCDGNPANGCEKNLMTDVSNCGACGRVCNLLNANASCSNGTCQIASCKPVLFNDGKGNGHNWCNTANCNGNPSDGCETFLDSNSDCGYCGHVCPSGFSCDVNYACTRDNDGGRNITPPLPVQ